MLSVKLVYFELTFCKFSSFLIPVFSWMIFRTKDALWKLRNIIFTYCRNYEASISLPPPTPHFFVLSRILCLTTKLAKHLICNEIYNILSWLFDYAVACTFNSYGNMWTISQKKQFQKFSCKRNQKSCLWVFNFLLVSMLFKNWDLI